MPLEAAAWRKAGLLLVEFGEQLVSERGAGKMLKEMCL